MRFLPAFFLSYINRSARSTSDVRVSSGRGQRRPARERDVDGNVLFPENRSSDQQTQFLRNEFQAIWVDIAQNDEKFFTAPAPHVVNGADIALQGTGHILNALSPTRWKPVVQSLEIIDIEKNDSQGQLNLSEFLRRVFKNSSLKWRLATPDSLSIKASFSSSSKRVPRSSRSEMSVNSSAAPTIRPFPSRRKTCTWTGMRCRPGDAGISRPAPMPSRRVRPGQRPRTSTGPGRRHGSGCCPCISCPGHPSAKAADRAAALSRR